MTYHTTVVIYNNTTQRLQVISVIGKSGSFDGEGPQGQLLVEVQSRRNSGHKRVELTNLAGRYYNGELGMITLTMQFQDGGIFKFAYNQCMALKKYYPKYAYKYVLQLKQNTSKDRSYSVDLKAGGPDTSISKGHYGSITITITQEINRSEENNQNVNQGFAQVNNTVTPQAVKTQNKKVAKDQTTADKFNKQGLALMRNQDFQKAIKKFNKAFQEDEKSEYMANVAKCYNQLGKHNKALEAAEQALQCDSEDQKAIKQKKIAKKNIKEERQDKAEDHDQRGEEYAGCENHQKALIQFKKAFKLTKDIKYIEKARQCEQVLQRQDQSYNCLQRGLASVHEGQIQQSVAWFNKALELDPRNQDARNNLNQMQNYLKLKKASQINLEGVKLYQRMEFQKAAAKFNQALQYEPSNQMIRTNLINAQKQEANIAVIQNTLANTVEMIKKNPGKYEEAIVTLNSLLKLNPNSKKTKDHLAAYIRMKAVNLFNKKQFSKGINLYNEMINLNPMQLYKNELVVMQQHQGLVQQTAKLREQGEKFEKEQNYLQAIKCYEKALAFNPNDNKLINRLNNLKSRHINEAGLKLCTHRQFQKAVQKFTLASLLNPASKQIKKNLATAQQGVENEIRAQRLRIQGDFFNQRNQLDKALQKYTAAHKLNPKGKAIIKGFRIVKSKIINQEGVALHLQSKYQEAILKFNKALTYNPTNEQIQVNLINTKLALTRFQASKQLIQKGNLFLRNKQYKQAQDNFNCVLTIYSDISSIVKLAEEGKKSIQIVESIEKSKKLHLQGRQYFAQGQFQNAVTKINEASVLNPTDQLIKNDLVTVKRSLEKYQRSLILQIQGHSFHRNSQFQKAIEKYTEALASAPNNAKINAQITSNLNISKSLKLNSEGISCYQQSQYQSASNKFQQALALTPNNQQIKKNLNSSAQMVLKQVFATQFYLSGEQFLNKKQYEKAIQAFNKIITDYAQIKIYADKARGSLVIAKKLDAINKLSIQGESLLVKKEYLNASIKFNQVLALNPGHQKSIVGLANARKGVVLVQSTKLNVQGFQFFNKGQYANALAKFSEAAAINPQEPVFKQNVSIVTAQLDKLKIAAALNLQGVALNQISQHEKAISKFKEALVIDPTNEQYLKNVQIVTNNLNKTLALKLNLEGIGFYQKGQYANAISKFQQSLQKSPTQQIKKNLESATQSLKSKQANQQLHGKMIHSIEVCKNGIESFKKNEFQEAIKFFDDAINIHNRSIYHSNKQVAYLSQQTVDFKKALSCAKTALQLKFQETLKDLNQVMDEKARNDLNLFNQSLEAYYSGCIQGEEENDFEAVDKLEQSIKLLEKVDMKYRKVVQGQYQAIIKKYVQMKIYEHGFNLATKCSKLFPEQTKFSKLITLIDQQNDLDLKEFFNREQLIYQKYAIIDDN